MRYLLLTLALLPLSALAHGDSPSLEAEVGKYLIDIGYEPELVEETEIAFDFDLFHVGPPIDYADFATVEVRIAREGMEVLNETLTNDGVNVPTLSAEFPEKGGYDLDVRYMDQRDTLIVARTFHLEVLPASAGLVNVAFDWFHYALAAFLVIFTGFLMIRSFKLRFNGKK